MFTIIFSKLNLCHNFLQICASGAWNRGADLHEFGDCNQQVLGNCHVQTSVAMSLAPQVAQLPVGEREKKFISTILEKFAVCAEMRAAGGGGVYLHSRSGLLRRPGFCWMNSRSATVWHLM